jgi:hypothetical protein
MNRSQTGLLGFGVGLFYQQGRNIFSINYGQPALFIPSFPKSDAATTMRGQFIEGLVEHAIWRQKLWAIGGINYTLYQYQYTNSLDFPNINKTDPTFGLTLGAEWKFSPWFSTALIYRPAVYSWGIQNYRHILSLDLRFNIFCWRK